MPRHIPHVVIGAPWSGDLLTVPVLQQRHLTKVLRLKPGDKLSYTDGLGNVGEGRLQSSGIERGQEHQVERPSDLVVAAAPPTNKERQRFLVEKLTEMGTKRLIWIKTKHSEGRVAKDAKLFSWVLSAVEQSRGAWLMDVSSELIPLSALDASKVFCQPGGSDEPMPGDVLVVGPEGGFAENEIAGERQFGLGPTILRVETAALVGAARLIGG